jgi:uncharacterized Tic20 family protein
MKNSSTGSYLSFGLALCYVIGFVCLFLFLGPLVEGQLSKDERLAFFLNNKLGLQFWYLIIYVLFGILLIPLISILKTHFKRNILNEFGSIVGFIWAAFVIASGFIFTIGIEKISQIQLDSSDQYVILTSIQIVQDALGGGVDLLGGIWVLCIGLMGLRSDTFHKYFNLYSLLLGAVGILNVLPFFYSLGGVFGMLQITWFIWLGSLMWRNLRN